MDVFKIEPVCNNPAAFTRISILSHSRVASPIILSAAVSSVKSIAKYLAYTPSDISLSLSSDLATINTLACFSRKAFTVASPIPELAPVIITVLSLKSMIQQ